MEKIWYRDMRPAIGQTHGDVIRVALNMGYELVLFSGWSLKDFEANKREILDQREILNAVQDACELNYDFPFIDSFSVEPTKKLTFDENAIQNLLQDLVSL